MWKLSIEDDQGHKTVVNLVRDTYSIGRAQENTVRLTERNISRHHATVRRQGSAWVLEDQASYNGCYLNGTRLAEPRVLEHGDLVQLGDYRVEVISEAASAQIAAAPGGTLPQVPRVQTLTGQPDRLVMVVGPNPGMEYPITDQTLIVGRGEECDISINHSSVSRLHCEIHTLGNGRHEIIDRGSANGVRVNGVELERWVLDARDKIELGDIVLKFIPAGMIYRPGVDESQTIPLDGVAATAGQPHDPHRPKVSSTLKFAAVGAILMGAALAVALVFFGARRKPVIVSRGEPVQVDPASQALAEAQSLLERGRIDAAHSHLMSNIPESSNARRSETFRAIENAWADEQLRRAQQQPGRDEKRSYLERVVKSTTVDLERRRRAAEYLATLDTDGVSPNQLNPSSPSGNDSSRGALEDTASAAGSDPRALAASGSSSGGPGTTVRSGTTVKNTGVLQGSLPSGTGPGSLRPTGAGASTTGQGTAGSTLAGRSPLLLREDPYAEPGRPGDPKAPRSPTPNAMDEATSGDRAKQMAAKDQLKSKCASGHCTDQEKRTLRALCRAFSDPGCSR